MNTTTTLYICTPDKTVALHHFKAWAKTLGGNMMTSAQIDRMEDIPLEVLLSAAPGARKSTHLYKIRTITSLWAAMGLVPEYHDTIIGDRGAIYITVMDAHKLSVNGKSDILLKENLSILRESKSRLDQRISEAIAEEFGL